MNYYPLVSVCIPAYNAEKYIAEALDSVLNQTYKNIEIIVCNDGSKDNTAIILEGYFAKGVKVIQQENKGQCAAANAAFYASHGEFIKFFDADDILSPNFIELQVQKINGKHDVVASSEWGRFFKDDKNTFIKNPENVWKDMQPIDWLVDSLSNGQNMMQCALFLIPRKLLKKSGLWDERLSLINDFDFFIRVLLSAQKILFTRDAVLYYRSGVESSLSKQKSRKAYESAYLSTDLGILKLLQTEDSPRTRKIAADQFQIWLYQFYPNFPDLVLLAESKVKNYGGSSYPIPARKPIQVLAKLIGWKNWYSIKKMIKK